MSTAPALPQIPGFELLEVLGRGGMATVYSATQDGLGRRVAIKVVHPRRAEDQAWMQRLENEAQALAGLQHPHIVDIYQFGRTAEGDLYYVMPLLGGGDLTQWSLPADPADVEALLDALLQALSHAHAQAVIHRDIKPENILFDLEGRAHLADFGAALTPARTRITHEGMVMGSTGYMSPEQSRGQEIDARSDLYSLAVVAYELLAGRLPFLGTDALSIALAQCEEPVPTLPAPLGAWNAFFDRALAVQPSQRFASAEEMRSAMRSRRPASALGRRPFGAAFALSAALIAVVLVLAWWQMRPTETPAVNSLESLGVALDDLKLGAPDQARELDDRALDWLAAERKSGRWSDAHDAQAARLLEHRADAMRPALLLGDPLALAPLWRHWRSAVVQLDAVRKAAVVQRDVAVESLLRRRLSDALADYDLRGVASVAEFIDAGAPVDDALRERVAQASALPEIGETFSDPGGPELMLITAPTAEESGVAIMRRPLDDRLHRAFNEAQNRTPAACARSTGGLRACIGMGDAQSLAAWLSRATGARYRLPSRSELEKFAELVEGDNLSAWTSTCARFSVAPSPERPSGVWKRVKSAFGAKTQTPSPPGNSRRCEGYITVSLPGASIATRSRPDEDSTVVLLREVVMPAPRPPGD